MSDVEEGGLPRASTYESVGRHPIFYQHAGGCLWTLPVVRLYADIKCSILSRQSAYAEAVTGQGQTCAVELILRQLPRDFEGLACVSFNAKTSRIPSGRGFFREFLSRLGYPVSNGGIRALQDRAIKRLEEAAVQSPWDLIWLWIDEAQALSDEEFCFFQEAQRDLRAIETDLVVLLTGAAPQLKRRVDSVTWSRNDSVPDRLALKRLSLGGYNRSEVQSLFAEMDRAVWPPNSSVTWTEFFFPKAFRSGFRMTSQAEACTDALADKQLLRSDSRCEARLLRCVVECFFLDNAQYDQCEMTIPAVSWINAVIEAKGR